MGMCSISLVMNGIKKCSGSCLYCSAASTMCYRSKENQTTFVFDKKKTKAKILEYCDEQLKEDSKNNQPTSINIDIWGGNPLENIEPFKQVVAFCEDELKEFKTVNLHTSGNGLELKDKDLVDYLSQHNIHYQLSHDGLGQWIRTGVIDPLYWDKTKDNIAKLANSGILDWINCTLSARNPSFFANIAYWNKWRKEIGLNNNLVIKLNHIYEGTPPINTKWYGPDNEFIKHNEVIGDLCFHGDVLQEYLHEFRKLAIICHTPGLMDSWDYLPYVNYIQGQDNRYSIITNDKQLGACIRYQRGLSDKNFAIDTKGNYCQCNLIDSDNKVKNPTARQPEYCKNCKYRNTQECNPCGSEDFPEKCEYHWWWNKTLEETFSMLELIRALSGQHNQCSCNKPQVNNGEAVFCVKNYAF